MPKRGEVIPVTIATVIGEKESLIPITRSAHWIKLNEQGFDIPVMLIPEEAEFIRITVKDQTLALQIQSKDIGKAQKSVEGLPHV
jgi:hypothetical protein